MVHALPRFTIALLMAQVPKDSGPKDEDPSSVHYPYFSTVNYVTDEYNGLIGVVMIARQGTLTAEGALRLGYDLDTGTPACTSHILPRLHAIACMMQT